MEDGANRVRFNFTQDAKGFVKRDITVEFPSVQEAEKAAMEALDAYDRVVTTKGLKLLQPSLSA
jgi:hypothetical protein